MTRTEIDHVRAQLLELAAQAAQAKLRGELVPQVRVQVGERWAVLAWPAERIVVWSDTRTPLSHR